MGTLKERIEQLSWRDLLLGMMVLIGLLSTYQALSHLHLFSDGAHVLMNILTTQSIFTPNENRFLSNLLQQFLPFLLIKMGVTDIQVISLVFGLNLYLIPLLSVVISFSILEKEYKGLVLIPLSWLLFVNHNNYAFILSEAYVTTAIFWPLITYALFKRLRIGTLWIFYLGVFCLAFTHELAFILISIILLGLLLNSWLTSGGLLIKGITVLFTIFCIAISWSNISAIYLDNVTDQISQLASLKQYPLTAVAIIILIYLSLAKVRKSLAVGMLSVFGVMIVLVLIPLLNPYGILYPILHWEQRILILLSTVILSGVFIGLRLAKKELHSSAFWSKVSLLTLVMTISFYQMRMISVWNSYRSSFEMAMDNKVGLVDYHQTNLYRDPKLNQFITPWTTNTTDLILQSFKGNEIKALIWLREDIWQAWYSSDRNHWPDLRNYGITYRLFGPASFRN